MVRRFTNTSVNSRWGKEESIIFPSFFQTSKNRKVVHMTLQVPTILIGLGGIGSTVTHQIYERTT